MIQPATLSYLKYPYYPKLVLVRTNNRDVTLVELQINFVWPKSSVETSSFPLDTLQSVAIQIIRRTRIAKKISATGTTMAKTPRKSILVVIK